MAVGVTINNTKAGYTEQAVEQTLGLNLELSRTPGEQLPVKRTETAIDVNRG